MDQIPGLLAKEDVDGLTALLVADERQVRIAAAQALGQLCQPSTIPSLIGAMGDAEVPVRWAAAKALTQIGRLAIPALITTLDGEGGRLAPFALWALGEIGSPLAIDALIEASSSKEWRVRWSAAEALGDLRGRRAIDALIDALGDRDVRVRKAACEALQEIGEPAVEWLAVALRHSDKLIRQTARLTLHRIDCPAAQDHLRRAQLVFWIPVLAIVIGALLVIIWLASLII